MLVFAARHEGRLRPLGAGNEGEFLLAGETVYCRYGNLLEIARPEERFGAYTYPYEPIRAIVLGYRKCFEFAPPRELNSAPRIRQLASDATLNAFARKSALHAELVSSTREYVKN